MPGRASSPVRFFRDEMASRRPRSTPLAIYLAADYFGTEFPFPPRQTNGNKNRTSRDHCLSVSADLCSPTQERTKPCLIQQPRVRLASHFSPWQEERHGALQSYGSQYSYTESRTFGFVARDTPKKCHISRHVYFWFGCPGNVFALQNLQSTYPACLNQSREGPCGDSSRNFNNHFAWEQLSH